MSSATLPHVAESLARWRDPLHALAERLLRRERRGHTLQATALLHEAFLRLRHCQARAVTRTAAMVLFARSMRRVLVDHARRRRTRLQATEVAASRMPAARSARVLELDAALRRLAASSPRQAEVVELRFFGGLSVHEVASCLGITERTVGRDWTAARAALRADLEAQ